jgi:formylglycine-generating enzyme required for sulfatase activity
MARWHVWLRCIGQAVVAKGLKALAQCVPFGEAFYDIAADALQRIKQEAKGEAEQRAGLQELVQVPADQVLATAPQIARQVAPEQPPAVQEALALYLSQVPGVARRSLSRPADPSGRSVPANLSLTWPEELLPFLPPRPPRFRPGDRPASLGDWELVELLGAGGFGEVWKARHVDLHGTVAAVKFCLDPASQERLLRHESGILNEIMKQGRHPGIVALLDARLKADPPWLKYEYVEGGDLAGLAPAFKAAQATPVIAQLASIVGHFHRLDPAIVHRDLKPANVLAQRQLNGTYRLRVADFGIGGLAARQALSQSQAGTARGDYLATVARGACTPLYASPQQRRMADPDVRDDVYALGVMWYQLLIGDLGSERPGGRWRKRVAGLGLSAEALDLLESCCDHDPDERPADAADLADRLKALAQSARAVNVPAAPPPASSQPQTLGLPAAPQQPLPTSPPLPENRAYEPARESIITNSLGMRLVRVPRGTFWMGGGGGKPVERQVGIPYDFYLGAYPVTQGLWEALMGSNPSYFSPAGGGKKQVKAVSDADLKLFPVEQVSWDDAQEFLKRLNARETNSGWVYRLPTEAEWEYACRGGASSKEGCSYDFYFDRPTNDLTSAQANFGNTLRRTSKVGSYRPNRLGLYDMHGNVWEWCNGLYKEGASHRVYRGGCWANDSRFCRAADRDRYEPSIRYNYLGLRVARVPVGVAAK